MEMSEPITKYGDDRDAPLPNDNVRRGNLEMSREILAGYEHGDDRPLVIGWAVRLAAHLIAADAALQAREPASRGEANPPHGVP